MGERDQIGVHLFDDVVEVDLLCLQLVLIELHLLELLLKETLIALDFLLLLDSFLVDVSYLFEYAIEE